MARTDQLRFKLPCLGGAAVASATLGDSAMVASLSRAAEESMSMTTLPFESASVLKSFFDAYRVMGDETRADEYRRRARTLARKNGYFEIVLATESAEPAPTKSRPATAPLSQASLSVIQSLEALETEPVAGALALTP
jgi:hypothetical protein